MKKYTWGQILKLNVTKREFAHIIGIDCPFDAALPQGWLDNFVKETGLEYHKVVWSCFSTYPKNGNGMEIVSGWDTVANILEKEKEKQND